MNIKTTTLHTINTTEEKLKKNLYSSYLDLLTDSLGDDLEYFEKDAQRLSRSIQEIHKLGFKELFENGYTMMLLDAQDFEFVERFHNKPKFKDEEELVVKILMKDGTTQVVSQEDLSY